MQEATIAAIATAPGAGGIAVVRLSGAESYQVAARVFCPANAAKKVEQAKGYTAMYGAFREGNETFDEGVALFFRAPEKLTAAAQAVARKDLDSAVFSGAKVREYESALQALQTMGDELTGSLQKQWDMEQRQREQIIQLSHKLKTPLTIIEGNAELLAEDDLTEEQRAQVEAILQGAEQTRTYLGKIRAEVQTPLKYRQRK